MIDAIIDEIDKCLENNLYMSALTLCLVLPDMCGRVEYPEYKGNKYNKKRYVGWFDKYAAPDPKYCRDQIPYINGQIVYDLRSNVIHAGDPDVSDNKSDIQKFELLVQENGRACYEGTSSTVISHFEGTEEVVDCRKMTISLRDLCTIICCTAKKYYKENKDKFSFKYNVVNMEESLYDAMYVKGLRRKIYKKED